VTADTSLPDGWHHIAAVRDTDRLKLYVDGKSVATSATFTASEFNLSSQRPLKIGFGAQDHFYGRMADVRIYRGALSMEEIQTLASEAE